MLATSLPVLYSSISGLNSERSNSFTLFYKKKTKLLKLDPISTSTWMEREFVMHLVVSASNEANLQCIFSQYAYWPWSADTLSLPHDRLLGWPKGAKEEGKGVCNLQAHRSFWPNRGQMIQRCFDSVRPILPMWSGTLQLHSCGHPTGSTPLINECLLSRWSGCMWAYALYSEDSQWIVPPWSCTYWAWAALHWWPCAPNSTNLLPSNRAIPTKKLFDIDAWQSK